MIRLKDRGRPVGKSGSISVGVVALTPMTQHWGENKREDQELKAILSYIVSFEQHGLHKTLPQSKQMETLIYSKKTSKRKKENKKEKGKKNATQSNGRQSVYKNTIKLISCCPFTA